MKSYKKILLTLLVAMFGLGMAQAELRFGVKAGLNLNSIHFSKDKEAMLNNLKSDNQCGFTAGVMAEFQVPIIGICADLSAMYTRMNSEVEDGGKDMDVAKNFLEIPLNIKYKLLLPAVSRFVAPYVFTGPSFAVKLDKNAVEDAFKTKTCQVAWNIGIGVELLKHLQISGSYALGMNHSITRLVNDQTGFNLTQKAKNNYWTITAAYLF